jgi:hypothetical protein
MAQKSGKHETRPARSERPGPAAVEQETVPVRIAAAQHNRLDTPPAGVTRGPNRTPGQETTMDQKTVFTQMQQFGSEWMKLMSESTSRFTAALAEVEKFEKQGVAQAVTAVEEASRVAKEAITAGEQISAQWRKSMNEYAQRTLDLITPKN